NLVLSHLKQTAANTNPNLKVTYFAGAYSNMLSFWGLTNLTASSANFYGLPDYASTMAFELRRPANGSGVENLSVRFGFRNGSDLSNAAAGGIGAGVTIGVMALIEGALALCYFSRRRSSMARIGEKVPVRLEVSKRGPLSEGDLRLWIIRTIFVQNLSKYQNC